MADVLEFPGGSLRSWRSLRPTIIDVLKETGLPENGVQSITERMKDVWLKYDRKFSTNVSFSLPANMPKEERDEVAQAIRDGIKDVEGEINDLMNEVILDRLKLEVKLYLAQMD